MKKVKIAFIEGTNYRITNFGEVINKYGCPLKGSKLSGYQRHTIQADHKTININTAREVYKAFKGPIPKGWEIDHIDGNKTNNNIRNLRCVTHKANANNKVTKTKLRGPRNILAIKYEPIN